VVHGNYRAVDVDLFGMPRTNQAGDGHEPLMGQQPVADGHLISTDNPPGGRNRRVVPRAKQQVRTAPGDGRADTGGVVLPPCVRVPAPSRLGVGSERHGGENLPISLGVDQVTHLPAEIDGQIGGVRHHHYLLVRVFSKKPSRKINGNKLGFTMTGWHINANPVFFPSGDFHQQVSQHPVVFSDLIIRLHVLTEGDQVVLTPPCELPCGQSVRNLQDFGLFIGAEGVDVGNEVLDVLIGQIFDGFRHRGAPGQGRTP